MEKGNEFVSVVHHLIERCKEGQIGYAHAAKDIEDPELKSLFHQYSVQRDQMVTELQHELHQMGKTDDESTSIEGTIHRTWMDLSSALLNKDKKQVLREAERGEDYAVAAFDKALQADLPGNLKTIVQKQYQQVKEAHDRIRDLRDSA
ncbi:PA2169 family four-helix-bundle protein [Adhaeribacter aquaticus]|uniref:PA2169 family four-helix-bundle protein n=1 Tax=Adhaeribacter aquaticus TaxID=299567 RepID=UPI00041BD86C|nr:PA2169 family four-helix-bundle protein [Adhaeribacter aquaticus]